MPALKKIRFILNPISGIRSKKDIPLLIDQQLNKSLYDAEVLFSKSADHVKILCHEAIENGYDAVIAAGGDGTLNLVASALVHSKVAMGIIPLGSGNGFARALGIPMDIRESIRALNHASVRTIDTGTVNEHTFINVFGLGFDAHVSARFAEAGTRGLRTYARISLEELRAYREQNYTLTFNGNTFSQQAFILAVCNGPQYGNNAYIAPLAEFADGMFDITILEKVNWKNILGLTGSLFTKNLHLSSSVKTYRTREITLEMPEAGWIQVDGEPIKSAVKTLHIQLHSKSLQLLTPAT